MFKKLTSKKIEFISKSPQASMFPPKPAKYCLPQWYKDMSTKVEDVEYTADYVNANNLPQTIYTVKRCVPFQDFLLTGYMIFFFSEILISERTENEYKSFSWATPSDYRGKIFGMHPYGQCPVQFNGYKKDYVKFFSGFGIKTPPGYSTLILPPVYQESENFTLFPAIVDTDTYHDQIGIIGYLKNEVGHLKVETGKPMCLVIPFKRDNWHMEIKEDFSDADDSKFNKLKKQFFDNVYRNFFHSKKRFD